VAHLRKAVAQFLILLLIGQMSLPLALAAPLSTLSVSDETHARRGSVPQNVGGGNKNASGSALLQLDNVSSPSGSFGIELTALSTAFNNHIGIEYHQPTRRVLVSANYPSGQPHNFELIEADGVHRAFSNVGSLSGELKLATARDDGQGQSLGGFGSGELFVGTGAAGVVARVTPDGASVQNPWVTLEDEAGLPDALYVDRTGVYGGDLIVGTSRGGVWRVNSSGAATRVANLGAALAGLTTIPDDVDKYGPWAGRILVGAQGQGTIYAIDAQGVVVSYTLGVRAEEIRLIPAHENFYGVDSTGGKLWGAPADAFTGMIGDVLVAQDSPGVLSRVHWNGTEFEVRQVAQAAGWKQVTFAPSGIAEIAGVKQVYDKIAVVRHAPQLSGGGRVEGALWQLLGENVSLNGNSVITSDLLVPGAPTVSVSANNPNFGGVITGTESPQPTGYTFSLSGNASVRHLITRTNPLQLTPVPAPPAPAGTRDVSLSQPGSAGEFSTLRNLSLSGKAGAVAVPPGTYGKFSGSGAQTAFVLGVANSTEPSVYNLSELSLSGSSELRVVGPVKLTVKNNVSISGSTIGAANNPRNMTLQVAVTGAVSVSGNGVFYGVVRAPQGAVSLSGNGRIRGTVSCDRLNISGNGVLQVTENAIPPPPVNRPPTADAGPDQTITLPADTVSLSGLVSDDGLPAGSSLRVAWSRVSGPAAVVFGDAGNATTTATFNEPGVYVLKLKASDGVLTSEDETRVEVVPRNQSPTADAGADQSIELPNSAALSGTAGDDALPRGSTLTFEWSASGSAGTVTFANPNAAVTGASFSAPGVYTLKLSASDTEFTVSDETLVTVYPENQPPTANAGEDQTVRLPNAANLNGSVSDDGFPFGSTLTSQWSQVSGPGTVTFQDALAAATRATFSQPGTYLLRLTVSDTRLSVSDDVAVEVLPSNQAPAVDAGTDRVAAWPGALSLSGSANDDGLPASGELSTRWSKVSGPGTVTFGDASQVSTPVTFSAPGAYVLRLTASDSELSSSDELLVSLSQTNQAPLVNAGADRIVTLPGCANPAATATDDGLPTGSTLSFRWRKVSGPGTVTFGDAATPETTVCFSAGGTYVLRLTASDSGLAGSDDVSVAVNNAPHITSQPVTIYQPSSTASSAIVLNATVRDLKDSHPDFEKGISGHVTGLVRNQLGTDSKPVFAGPNGVGAITDATSFSQWYNDAPGINLKTVLPLELKETASGSGVFTYESSDFFPIDGQLFGNQGRSHNFHFTLELHSNFTYKGGEVFQFTGDDDIWVFIDKRLVVDLGGVHAPVSGAVNLDTLGLTPGQTYSFNFFFAERHTSGSNFRLQTSINLEPDRQYTYQVQANDPNGDPLAYDLLTAPDGMKIDSATGLITWNPGADKVGAHNVSLKVTDGRGGFDTQSYALQVIDPRNKAPLVNAGPDQTIALPQTASLSGTATDDGLPTGSTLTRAWSVVSGPGTVTFSNPTSLMTTASFSGGGVYVLRLTANDSQLLSQDDVTVTVIQPNQAPAVDAGADQTMTLPASATLSGTINDDGLPGRGLITLWSQVGGPGGASIGNADQAVSNVSFSAPGTYVFRLTVNDFDLTSFDEVTFTVNPAPCLKPPTGLVSWWPGEGNFGDLVFGNHGVPLNGTNFAAGKVGQAFNLDGTDDAVQVADSASLKPANISVAAWVKFNSLDSVTSDTGLQYVLFKRGNGPFEAFSLFKLRRDGVDRIHFLVGSNPTVNLRAAAVSQTTITAGQFYHLVGTYDGHDIRIYVNGVLETTQPNSFELGYLDGKPLVIGGSGEPFNGRVRGAVDEIQLYNRALSASEVQAVYNTGGTGLCADAVNRPPTVNAGADLSLTVSAAANLQGTATDDGRPEGSTLNVDWSVVSGPGAVAFDNPQQAATTATFSLPGTYLLRLTANDSEWNGVDEVNVNVTPSPGNQPPVVNAGPSQTITLPNTATLNGTAGDDGLPASSTLAVTWSKVSGAGTVTFGDAHQAATTANFSAAGSYVLRLSASDSELTRNSDVSVTINAANQTPTVNAGADQTITLPNNVALNGTATDDGLPKGSVLAVSWGMVSGPGLVTFAAPNRAATQASFSAPGAYVLRLTANDSALNASDEVNIEVKPVAPPPTASISFPADGSTITARTNFFGTVGEGTTWRLEYSLNSDDGAASQVWTTLAAGSTPVTNGLLGVFDPTLLLNGAYAVRLRATNASGQTSETRVSAVVEGEQKIGNFSLSYTDLNVPMAGMPIEVVRTYDSRDKRRGDFGVGWSLGVRNARVEKTGVLGAKWEETVSGGFLPTYCLQPTAASYVTVTFPNGRVYKFQARLNTQCQLVLPFEFVTVGFRQLPTTAATQGATLTALDATDAFVNGAVPGDVELIDTDTFEVYNPTKFRLTTADGYVYMIDQKSGVQEMSDPNGNRLTINSGGITHSSGKGVAFTHDSQGRITQISDPAGNALTYGYDAAGDLVSFKDREGNTTAYGYNSTHGLLSTRDPRGIQPVRNEYDDSGRLVRQIDAFGNVIQLTHDTGARKEVSTDRLGHATVFEYDARGNITRVTDAQGHTTTRTFDAQNNLLSETDALGKTAAYTYDAQNNKVSVTDRLGNTTRYTYNSRRQILTVTDPQGRVTTNTYDAGGNLLSVKDPLGNSLSVTYDARGQETSVTDALGNVTRFEYDAAGNMTKQIDPLGNVTTNGYDANGDVLSETVTRVVGAVTRTLTTSHQYDLQGRLLKTTYPDGSTTSTTYDALGNQTAMVNPLGRSLAYAYDELGRLIRTTYPDGKKDETVYDAEGQSVKNIDRAGRETSYTYDARGRLVKTVYPDGSFTAAAYNALGQATAVTSARGKTSLYEYDAQGRQTKVTDALGNATTYTYDVYGNRTSMTDQEGRTTHFEYDRNGRRTKIVYPDGTTSATGYDSEGQVVSKTDQAGRTMNFEYDGRGKLTKVTDALGGVTLYTYDEIGNQLTQTDANNHTTRYEYDEAGRRIKRTLPLGMSESYAYDLAGNLTSRTGFNGKRTTYAYDELNRLLSKTPDPSLGAAPVTFTYTAAGDRAAMTDASGTTTYTHDVLGRLLNKATPAGALTYSYDAGGNLSTVRSSNANGVSVNYTYDALDRLETVADGRAPVGAGVTAYAYDAVGNLAGVRYPNRVETRYAYDALNRLTDVSATKDNTGVANYAYTLDQAGHRLSATEAGGRTVDYTYDALNRLTKEHISGDAAVNGALDYTYDAVGNRLRRDSTVPGVTSSTSTYDGNDRLTSDTYDQNGNTVSSNGTTYTFNFEDRLASANGGGVIYTYDGDGNRVAKTVGGVTTRYLIDTNNLTGHAQVFEELQGVVVVRQYTYGHDLISQRQQLGGEWKTHFYGYDGHGSVRYLSDQSGVVTDTYTYDAFGNLLAVTGTTPNEYLYAGEQFDPHLGLYYLRARYMNTSTGRFFTRDTFEGVQQDPSTLHKYLYANSDPVNLSDPSGNFSVAETATTMAVGGIISSIMGMIFSNKSPSTAEFWGDAARDFGVGALTAPVGGLLSRLMAPLVKSTIGPLVRILGELEPIMLRGRGPIGKMLVNIGRFFFNTNRSYPRVGSTAIGKILQRAFPNVEWEMHHVWIQQAWSRSGGPNQLFDDIAANEGLRRMGNGLWNLLPIPAALNGALGRSVLGTQVFATVYYTIIVHGISNAASLVIGDDD
jgi:fibro-slime domain-containing protein/RHS repeat-associated protein